MNDLAPSAEILRRCRDIDGAYTAARLGVLAALPGNPVGAAVRRAGDGWAFAARYLPVASFNRTIGVSDPALLPELLNWFAEHGGRPRFEVAPGDDADALVVALAGAGFAPVGGFHATLYGAPAAAPTPDPGVSIEDVDAANFETFLDAHCLGWQVGDPAGFKANVRGWQGQEGWRFYIGRYQGQIAGAATLCLREGTAYCADSAVAPAFRGHGVHQALLRRRLAVAQAEGCDLVCAQAAYLSTSHRNMTRAGLALLHNRAAWVRP